MNERSTALLKLLTGIKDTLDVFVRSTTHEQEGDRSADPGKAAVEEHEDGANHRRGKVKLIFELGGLVAATLLAIFTLYTLFEMRRQTRQSLESTRIDERAWIEVEPIVPRLRYAATKDTAAIFTYSISIKNAGRTAAYDISVKALRDAPAAELSLGDNSREIAKYQAMMRPDTAQTPEVLVARRVSKTLGPGEVSTAPFEMTAQEPHLGHFQFLVGRIDYEDAFGVPHWMTYCLSVADSGGNLQYCQSGNDEDRNPEIHQD